MAYLPLATEIGAIYTLTSPDGLSVAVFNDPSSASYVGALTEVTGLDSAEVRESAQELPEADGGAHGAFYFGRRPVVLNGKVFGHTTIKERELRLDRARRASLALRGDSTLKWVPSTRRTNLIVNPVAGVDTTGWSTSRGNVNSGATLTRQTGGPSGSTYFRAVTSGSGSNYQGGNYRLSGPIAAGTYHARIYARQTTGTGAEFMVGGVNPVALTSSWAWYDVLMTTTGAEPWIDFEIRHPSSGSQAGQVEWTYALLEANTTGAYFDGATTGGVWTGTAHNSTSVDYLEVYLPVRRQQPFRESGAWVKDFQIPLVSDLGIIQSTLNPSVASGVAAENFGNYPAYPVLTFSGVSFEPSATAGGRTFATDNLTMSSGESVAFDMRTHTGVFTAGARAGQSANRYIDFSVSTWPYLAGLGTSQTFSLSGGGTLSVSYRHTWA